MTTEQPFRLAEGGRIDRSRALSFRFNGRALRGYAGDTLASALLANGVRIVGRSFKFHRPRGVVAAGVEEPNALLAVDQGAGPVPLTRATTTPLVEGLAAATERGFPSLRFDFGRILDLTRALWPAGFYNKTFIWPRWSAYEWALRRAAGLGRLPEGRDPTRYRHRNVHCDVLVVGTGPAGLAAALAAGARGERVLVAEQDREPGGALLFDPTPLDGRPAADWLEAALAELGAMENVTLLTCATVAGYYDHNVLTIHDCAAAAGPAPIETLWKVRAGRVVLAAGAIEQPVLFANNDLPGVMLAGAMHQYAVRYGVRCGQRVAGVVNNDPAWGSLLALADAGVQIAAIIDPRADPGEALQAAAADRDIPVHAGAVPRAALGWRAVRGLDFALRGGARRRVACDAIAMSGGLAPAVHLYSQAGGRLRYAPRRGCFVPAGCRQRVEVVGAAAGDFGGEYRIDPRRAGPIRTGAQWVDFLADVTVADVELAVRENFTSVEHLKRYTGIGMASDQGKTSNLNALTLLAEMSGRTPGEIGTTTYRPQYTPVSLGAIGGSRRGELYAPVRRLPGHDWHAQRGAAFDDYGGWRRPAWYGTQRDSCIAAEVRRVREAAGLFDASPLGKIEVKGPDAGRFLDRVYVNAMSGLQPGRVRYGLMLNENGIIIDDGVCARLAADHFLLSTSAANAGRVAAWLDEWLQGEWPDLELVLAPVTAQWAVLTVAGPRARRIVQALPGMIDLAPAGFPHLSVTDGYLADGTPFRLQRVSYSGELSYELSVPADRAAEHLTRLFEAGAPEGAGMLGIEALLLLRLEKGFLHVGVDTDGTTTALDVGWGRLVAARQDDFIGARSLRRPADRRPDRRQLVGIEFDPRDRIRPGAHFVAGSGAARRSEGFVTSACVSPTLGRGIGLGLLERGHGRRGERVDVYDEGRIVPARVVAPGFYDPAGERLRA